MAPVKGLPLRRAVGDRFEEKVDRTGECHLWTGAKTSSGYGNFWDGERNIGAHIWAYEREHGVVGAGREVDHLCFVPLCVRLEHLEDVPQKVNRERVRVPETCPRGHNDWYPLRFDLDGGVHGRQCRSCERERRSAKAA